MSRNRFHTQQEVRASPVHWSEQSGDGSDSEGDSDEADGEERSPSRAVESQEYDDEDQEAYADSELRGSDRRSRYREASRSPMLNRRPIKQVAAGTKECSSRRGSSESYLPEAGVSKFQQHRQPKRDTEYRRQFHETKAEKPVVEVKLPVIALSVIALSVIAFLILIANPFGEKGLTGKEISHTRTKQMTAAVENALSQYENISPGVLSQISAGIRNIVESDPNIPAIFVFLHNNTVDGPFCLAKAIGNVAMKYLESEEEAPLILKPKELIRNENITEDYGWIIKKYRPDIEKHRSVIVADLQKFPGRMAMAFHFLCDTYNPVVPKSLFLFTLYVPDVHSKRAVEQAENAMHNIWRDEVGDDQRQALITRLTEDVISLPSNILHDDACP